MSDKKLKILPYKTERDTIKKLKLQEEYILPAEGLMIICGRTGSGKTVLICNLLKNKNMLKHYFDKIFVYSLSPCPMLEDHVNIPKENFFHDDNPEDIVRIVETQKEYIENYGFEKSPHILIILDDVAQSRRFLHHKILKELAFASTHSKISVWITTQNWMSITRCIRQNCHYIILCHGLTDGEYKRIGDEYQSAYMTKDKFISMLKWAMSEPYSFVFCNNTIPDKRKQFRKGFDNILHITDNI